MGLILEIQAGVISDESVESLLRKVKLASSKLGLDEVADWVGNELHGYKDIKNLPSYRKFNAPIMGWNPYHGWLPTLIEDNEVSDLLTAVNLVQSIGSIESLIKDSDGSSQSLLVPAHKVNILNQAFGEKISRYKQDIGTSWLVDIVSQVKNLILDWTMQIEKAGIEGDNNSFTPQEREVASRNFSSISIENFNGVMGDQNTISHSFNNQEFYEKIADLVDQVTPQIDSLKKEGVDTEVLVPILDELSNKPDYERAKSLLQSGKTVLEGASGSLLASGALHLFSALS